MSFATQVYEIVKNVPRGQVITYKQIGDKLHTKAYQAIGQALKHNPDPAHIPCHRVIKSDGSLGGYFGHTSDRIFQKKLALLRSEGYLL